MVRDIFQEHVPLKSWHCQNCPPPKKKKLTTTVPEIHPSPSQVKVPVRATETFSMFVRDLMRDRMRK